ncbi:MAG: hypothetical protein AAF750_12870 [Planctomycetota bacterium]
MWDELFGDVPSGFWAAMGHVLWGVDYGDALAVGYSVLNLCEAVAWFAVAVWVIRRHRRRGGGRWDWVYAGLFVVFGLTDVMESQVVPLWLVAVKGVVFGGIVGVRFVVVRRYYVGAKM